MSALFQSMVRGDFQDEGKDYDEKYAPVGPWSTVYNP
jgi:hypothetical protein